MNPDSPEALPQRYADLTLAEPLRRAVADMGYEFMNS